MANRDDRFYWITPEGGGKAERHTRATTFVKTLDDTYGLMKWEQRMAVLGLSRRPDLLAQVAAAYDDDAAALDSIVLDAVEAAGASRGRNLGTALHKFGERVDRGELELAEVPEPWRPDVEAYRKAMDAYAFDVEVIETTVVVPELGVAGTLDRLVSREGSELRVLDLKTGQKLWLPSVAMQMALYAHGSTVYNMATDTHSPMPEVNQSIGYVAHMPVGSGTCEIVTVDLEAGWRGAQLAYQVRAWRREPFDLPGESVPLERRLWLSAELRRLVADYADAAAALAQHWPIGVPTPKQARDAGGELTDEQVDAICELVHVVEGEWAVPFAAPDPYHRHALKAKKATKAQKGQQSE
jgi:hypothetical protein